MAYPAYIREKARELRIERRLTIDELAERLAIPRTTVYHWVRDLPIGQTEKRTLAAHRAGEVTRAIHRRRRAAAYERGRVEYPALLQEATFRDFVCMYVGEGYKRARNVVSICNSDPAVVRLGAVWIRRLAANPVVYSFQHHADQNPRALQVFWGQVVDVDPVEIKFQRKSNSGQLAGRSWRSQYGVLQVRTPDTYLRSRIQAWMDCLRAEWP
ncbi:MAG TPA: helix-turn-helix transcriptional regulator [Solirubrobacterales bacterium]|jgi:excisionase family DNA binding protein|nr:helix-turn-helix transcriptional regulator [Solirubrobacterales bacterium]